MIKSPQKRLSSLLCCTILTAAPIATAQTTYEYDALGRLIKTNYDNGSDITYSYDKLGNRTSVVTSEPPPSFSIGDVTVTEGASAVFTVIKTGTASQSYSVSFATANATATAGTDYTAQSSSLSFGISETSKTITVVTTDDTSQESTETFSVVLSSPSGDSTISDDTGIGTINDNDQETPPSFSISDVTVTEGTSAVFTVTKSGTVTQSYSVDFATANGTASAGSDYTSQNSTLTFSGVDTSKTITVATIDDSSSESTETFNVNLSSPTGGATITDSQGVGTVNDNDQSGPVSFSVNDISVTEGLDLVYTVTKAGNDGQTHTVEYDSKNGTATGSDYTNTVGTLTFTSSETTKTVAVPTGNDFDEEPDETIILELDNASSGATISDDEGTGTIINNDGAAAPVQFSVNDVSVTEGGDLVFTVTKTGDDGLTHDVEYEAKNGTSTGSDYEDADGTLTFTAAQFSKTVLVETVQDTKVEGNETVILELDNAGNGAAISDDQGVGTIIDDD